MGSWIAEELVKRGHYVLVVDDLSGGYLENIPDGAHKSIFDVRNAARLQGLFMGFKPHLVYHLACHPHEGLSQFMPMEISSSVLEASLSVFKAAVNSGTEKIVTYSSMARYGDANGRHPPFSETDVCTPRDTYGSAKLAADYSLMAMAEAHGLKYVILVPHNVVGPQGQNLADPYRNVLAIFIRRLIENKPLVIFGDGEQRRAFSDIRDSLPCYIRAGFDDVADGEVINIGSVRNYTINELAQMVLEEFGGGPDPIHVPDRPCEVKHAYCTIEKSRRLLGFEEKHSLRDCIRDFIAWARTQELRPLNTLRKEEVEIEKNMPEVWRNNLR